MNHPITTTDAVATWKLAHRFVLDVYRLTERLPQSEQAGLTAKIRMSAVKVASNIVEGYARKDGAAYLTHLSDAQVSLEEVKYTLLVARDLGYISEGQYDVAMAQGEDISERLEAMRAKLAVTEAATQPETRLDHATHDDEPKLFGQRRGVRDTAKGLWGWVTASTGRLKNAREEEPNVWTETPSMPSYLEEAKTWNLEEHQHTDRATEAERDRFTKLG